MSALLTLVAVGCAGGPELSVRFTVPPPERGVGLVAELSVEADEPCALEVSLRADDHERVIAPPGTASVHQLPVLGVRAGRSYDVEVRCVSDRGEARETAVWDTPALPGSLPDLMLLAHQPSLMEPGYTLFDARATDRPDHVIVVDEDLEVVWYQQATPPSYLSVVRDTDGTLLGNAYPHILRGDWLGQRIARWGPQATTGGDVEVGLAFHHDAVPLGDGRILGLTWRLRDVPAFPSSYDSPDVLGPATIVDDGVVVFREDGTVEATHWLGDVLDTSRIGYDSLDPAPDGSGADWAHANAVVPDPRDGGFLVTLRHQDALVKLTDDGELVWILSSPSGWQDPWAARRLNAVGELEWPFHAHSATFAEDGTIVAFDNGNYRATPYDETEAPTPSWSRVVAYQVDEAAGTVEQLWEHRRTSLGELYSPALGDADPLPITGNVLAVFGRTLTVDGVAPSQGLGESVAHIIEFNPQNVTAEPIVHLALTSPRAELRGGWSTYRAERIPGFYAWD